MLFNKGVFMKANRKPLIKLGLYLLTALASSDAVARSWQQYAVCGGFTAVGICASQLYSFVAKEPAKAGELEKGILIKALLGQYEEVRSERDGLLDSAGELQCMIDELEKFINLLTTQNDEVAGEKGELVKMCEALQQELETLRAEYEQTLNEKKQLAEQLDAVEGTQRDMEEQRAMYEVANNELCKKVLAERDSLISSTSNLQKMLDNIELQVKEMRTERTGLVGFFDGLKGKLDSWRSSYAKKAETTKKQPINNKRLLEQLHQLRMDKSSAAKTTQVRQGIIDKKREQQESRRITNLLG